MIFDYVVYNFFQVVYIFGDYVFEGEKCLNVEYYNEKGFKDYGIVYIEYDYGFMF